MKTLLATSVLFLFSSGSDTTVQHTFDVPADALSVTLPTDDATASVSYNVDGEWSTWEELAVDNEQNPLLKESNLILFPEAVTSVRFKSSDGIAAIHPIEISDEPVSYEIAATTDPGTPKILSRRDWGADDALLFRTPTVSAPSTTPQGNGDTAPPTQRVQDCEAAQLNYPNEFKVARREKTDDYSRTYRWTREYSKKIDLIAVHHTAVKVERDSRSGEERMRALYAYHANNRGWGDIGYHYLIDEDGQMYEGKSGGKYVVAGHAYCNNVNTLGVALLGNFEEEKPTQKQLKALQWLLADLGNTYDIDMDEQVTFHGKKMSPIVGHRDLISTACPGFYVYGALAQINTNVASGNLTASVRLPKKPTVVARGSRSSRTVIRKVQAASSTPRRVQRIIDSRASRLLLRKLRANVNSSSSQASSVRTRTPLRRVSSRSSARSSVRTTSQTIRIRLTRQETGATNCSSYDLAAIRAKYRGTVRCTVLDGVAALINTVDMEDYMMGLVEEPDTEPYEKQRAFAIAARSYATYYLNDKFRKFPGMPYDGSDSPATFQLYGGKDYEAPNPRWVKAVKETAGQVLLKDKQVIRAPYYSANDGRTRTPEEAGWKNFPFAEVFTSKPDPWCVGDTLRGHGVGMSGCGSEGQANEGKSAEDILAYYYPGTTIGKAL